MNYQVQRGLYVEPVIDEIRTTIDVEHDNSSNDGDFQCEEDCGSDDGSCDVELVDEDNEIQGDDVELGIHMSIPPSRLNMVGEWGTNNQELMGYSFDIGSDYEDSDAFDSLDEDSDEEKERFPKFSVKVDMSDSIFKLGMTFPSFQVLKEVVKKYSLKSRYVVKFVKNDQQRLKVICKDGCPWILYATPIQGGDKVQIRTLKDQHTCGREFKNKYATYVWIARQYLETIRANPTIPLLALQELLSNDFHFKIFITKLWRAKELAFKILRGRDEQQFLKLADYAGELRSTNLGSTLILSLDNLVFKRFFVCLSGCKNGFKAGCRTLISIDRCHLKGRYGGQLLAAVGIDPNDCIWPIAYAVVDVECQESWTWFLHLLGEELGIQNSHKWTFTSDRQKGLIQAVETLFPNAEHRFCVRHLIQNFKSKHPGETLKNTV